MERNGRPRRSALMTVSVVEAAVASSRTSGDGVA